MTAKRALNFGTPSTTKRRRTMAPTYVVRSNKTEMKSGVSPITHSATTSSNLLINPVGQGTTFSQRVGSKIKIWRIQGFVASAVSCRVDILLPNDATSLAPAYAYNASVSRDTYNVLASYTLNPTTANTQMFQINHKLPLGIVAKYDGAAGTTCVKNAILVRITNVGSDTITGYFRIWFTDN